MNISLSDHFTMKKMLQFTFSSIVMMVFSSLYSVADGVFVANFVGSNALASMNIVWPLFLLLSAVGFMLGTGGSAEVAKTMGEGRVDDANSYFTTLTIAVAVISTAMTVGVWGFLRPLSYLLGADEVLIQDCMIYGWILLIGNIPYMLQAFFQALFVTAEKPVLGMIFTVISGIANIFFDFLFMAVLDWGVAGAALGTSVGCALGGFLPLFYFARKNNGSRLHFVKPKFHGRMLAHSALNGSSEMVSNASRALTTFLFNIQLMRLVGKDGVSAISIMDYVNFVFVAVMIGFSVGIAPVIAFHYGAQNHQELRSLLKKCMTIIMISSMSMFLLAEVLSVPVITIMTDHESLYQLTLHGFRVFAISFIFMGINVFTSSFFTALCNGKISAAVAFLRTIVLEAGMILFLPIFLEIDGIWLAVPVAEVCTAAISLLILFLCRKRYHYAGRDSQ